jgi:hypothetical protein
LSRPEAQKIGLLNYGNPPFEFDMRRYTFTIAFGSLEGIQIAL